MNKEPMIPVYERDRRFSPSEFFNEIMKIVKQSFFTDEARQSVFDGKLELDYILSDLNQWYSSEPIRDAGFDTECVASYGASEGIYISVVLHGDLGIDPESRDRIYHIGTLKTLSADFEAMRACGELAGIITAVERLLVNQNIWSFIDEKIEPKEN